MKSRILRTISITSVLLLLGACGSLPGPTQSEWAKMSDERKASEAEDVADLAGSFDDWWDRIGKPLYDAHQPVRIGTKANGYTIQWHKMPGPYDSVSFYPGHNPPGIAGKNSEGMFTATANKKGEPIWRVDEGSGVATLNKLLANVATSEDLGTTLIRGGFQVTSAGVNGALASHIQTKNSCGNDCGNITVQNSSSSQALSEALSQTAASALIGGCTDGSCPSR